MATEIACDACNLIKPVTDFSKIKRKKSDPRCINCVAWYETQEPGVTPSPMGTGHISVEEIRGEVWTDDFSDARTFFSENDLRPQAPITSLAELGLADAEDIDLTAINAALASSIGLGAQPPTSTHGHVSTDGSNDRGAPLNSSTSHTRSTARRELPAHLRNSSRMASSVVSGSDAGSNYEGSTNASEPTSSLLGRRSGRELPSHLRPPGSVSTATTVRDARVDEAARRNIGFNAWDSAGNRIEASKSVTASSRTTSIAGGAGREQPSLPKKTTRGNFAKVTKDDKAPRTPSQFVPFDVSRLQRSVDNQRPHGFYDADHAGNSWDSD